MNTIRLISHSTGMLNRHKLRTSFMMLGSFVGVAALTLAISVGQAAERKMLKTVRQIFGDSSVIILDGGGRMAGGPRGQGTMLKIDDIAAVQRELAGIDTWDPQQGLVTSVRHADASDTAQVLGESERSERVWGRGVSRGTYFDETAVTASTRVAVIGETVAHELFKSEDPIGADIQIGSVPFRVIGILEPWGTDPHGMDRDNEIIVPISTLMRRLTNVDTIAAAKLIVSDPDRGDRMAVEIKRILRDRHGLTAGQPDDFSILTASEVRKMVATVQRILFLYLPLVAAISLIVGGVVSASLMVASVSERTSEIGLRRAIGARAGDIRLQFLIETAATTLAGGFAGILLGYVLAQLGAQKMHLDSVAPWGAALIGIAASTAVGLAAGLLPARQAARLSPADALR